MDESKRGFLKIAGSSVLGVLGASCTEGRESVLTEIETAPSPGALTAKRWGMVIDPKRCLREEGCTRCIDACHAGHNVPKIEDSTEEVKWIWKEPYEHTFPNQAHRHTEVALKDQNVLVFCNHCESPPCVRVCPTQATFKREEDGIVMMDQHRCIGCRYCMVACPYGSRSFNWRDPRPALGSEITADFPTRSKGVVEKCNFCAERLAKGEMPLCVVACENSGAAALAFGDLEDPDSSVSRILKEKHSIRRKPGLGTEPQVYYLV